MPEDASPTLPQNDHPPAASRAEQAARRATDQEIAPHEKQAIAIETSREEDA
ncbi:hypothetical protein ACN2C6_04260 [Caulobacter sp. ErkDOM-YI]|uniref:hypothetical protein n=1 Tax=unclassified Caulobacter TaxID=2648921 RepID=UPI003AF6D2FA